MEEDSGGLVSAGVVSGTDGSGDDGSVEGCVGSVDGCVGSVEGCVGSVDGCVGGAVGSGGLVGEGSVAFGPVLTTIVTVVPFSTDTPLETLCLIT